LIVSKRLVGIISTPNEHAKTMKLLQEIIDDAK
jgi:hypothetical protein